jgi:hypothetical protein
MKSRVTGATIAVAAVLAAWFAAPGCALFTDLNGSQYSTPDAGTDGACGEAGCGQPLCLSTADCGDAGLVCCLTASFTGGPTLGCQSACVDVLGVQLCQAQGDTCLNGAACMPQECSLGRTSFPVFSCATIPNCSLP